jgi:hypothetical protein
MSFNSVVLIVASIIFVLLLAVFTYFIYEAQKRKYNIVPASCPDYWTLRSNKDSSTGKITSRCEHPISKTNWGMCNGKNLPPDYSYKSDLIKPCDIFLHKYLWTTQNCGGTILWDGVTNNDDFRRSCKPATKS